MSIDPIDILGARVTAALVSAFGADFADVDPALRRSEHADYQCNVALALKKRVPGNPRETAAKIAAALEVADVCELPIEIAGPGFLNLKLRSDFLAAQVQKQTRDERLGALLTGRPETIVIDYSAPNIAKEMHVGHLRSSIIGDALARTLEFGGNNVIRQNHLGDWGTPFGMLIEHLIDLGGDLEKGGDSNVSDLGAFYRSARAKFDAEPTFAERSRSRVVLLQAGDEQTLSLWRRIVEQSHLHFNAVYQKLGVGLTREHAAGESLFNPMLAGVVAELEAKGITSVDQGALCVFPPGFKGKDGGPFPLIVRKSDGGYGYAATDLAAIKYRFQTLKADRAIYVVGSPQAQHLSMIYKVAEMAGWLAPPQVAKHVGFGSVLGEDGKILKSRAGEALSLLDLLCEADERALATVKEKNAERRDDPLAPEDEPKVAHAIGMAAIKYADLSSDRVKDYVFAWDRMLAANGNTGPYLQYAHARTCSIIKKSRETRAGLAANQIAIVTPEERALALALLAFPRTIHDVATSLEPHRLCGYLFDLASMFSSFFAACPVLKADSAAERASRLALCDVTARVMKQGLGLLGIEAPERM